MTTDPHDDYQLDDLRAEYAETGGVTSGGAVWLIGQVVVLREQVQRLTASSAVAQSAPAETALRDRIRRAVCEADGFAWDSDMLEPDEYGDHADMILAVLPAVADLAELAKQIDLRDYWHGEAMSATTRIIELEGQLEESRRAAAEPAADLPAVVPAGAGEEPADETSCPGFPDGCPTLIAVVPTVGSTHGGGLRCGCYDEPKEAAGHCIVAYRSTGARVLRCPSCYPDETTFREGDLHPVTSEDLPDGGLCTKCGVDVLIPQEPRP